MRSYRTFPLVGPIRESELAALYIEDVDFAHDELTVKYLDKSSSTV